jgi:hypothetical protein
MKIVGEVGRRQCSFHDPYENCDFHDILNAVRLMLEKAKKEHLTADVEIVLMGTKETGSLGEDR